MANIYDLSDTWNAGGTTFTAIKMSVTDTASAAASLLMDLQVGGVSRLSVAKTGAIRVTEGSYPATTNLFGTSTNGIGTYSNIVTIVANNTQAAWVSGNSLSILPAMAYSWASNGTSGGDLALSRDAANTLALRLSTSPQAFNLYNTYTDASNYERGRFSWVGNELRVGTEKLGTGLTRSLGLYEGGTRYQIIGGGFTQFDQPIYMNTTGIATGTATGFKIGTGATQKLGFWNATPVAQPTAVADATDAATVITQLNDLLARMRTIGLIAT